MKNLQWKILRTENVCKRQAEHKSSTEGHEHVKETECKEHSV